MRFPEYFDQADQPVISFELFPPKTPAGLRALQKRIIPHLVQLKPSYITVTYGAMGSTQEQTLEIASFIKHQCRLESACHLTCVGASRDELRDIIQRFADAGIQNIVALRGDPPQGQTDFVPPPDGFAHANDLVGFLREIQQAPFGIAVAGYPEKHLQAETLEADIANLRRKVDAGADTIITQLFYDNAPYFNFVEKVRAAGITVPVVPGLMPILSAGQILRITSMCGASIPPNLQKSLEETLDNDEKAAAIGVEQCIRQAAELLEWGVPGIHFYVLNKAVHIQKILKALPH